MKDKAYLKIHFRKITEINPAHIESDYCYFILKIGNRTWGRTKNINKIKVFALPDWQYEKTLNAGDKVTIELELWNDHNDNKPIKKDSAVFSLAHPWKKLEKTSGNMDLVIELESRIQSTRTLLLPYSIEGGKPTSVKHIRSAHVNFREIHGLYQPVDDPKRSEYNKGYTSEDNLGRVFTNHDIDGNWDALSNQIKLSVDVTMDVALMQNAKVEWTLVELDDPTNANPNFHRQWGKKIDPNDYKTEISGEGAGYETMEEVRLSQNYSGQLLQNHLDEYEKERFKMKDETGKKKQDWIKQQTQKDIALAKKIRLIQVKPFEWQEIDGFNMETVSNHHSLTEIKDGKSSVLLKFPDFGGICFMVIAAIKTDKPLMIFPAQTGLITIWRHIHSIAWKMKSIMPLPVEKIHASYEPACVQLTFEQKEMAPEDDIEYATRDQIDALKKKYKPKKGEFCVLGLNKMHKQEDRKEIFTINQKLKIIGSIEQKRVEFVYITVPGNMEKKVDSLYILGKDPAQDPQLWPISEFIYHSDSNTTDIYISAKNYAPFSIIRNEGVNQFIFAFPNGTSFEKFTDQRIDYNWHPNANFSDEVTIKGYIGRGFVQLGLGRSGIAEITAGTHSNENELSETITHELCHLFDLGHNCGWYDWQTPRKQTCVMNYEFYDMLQPDLMGTIPGTKGKMGKHFCGAHLRWLRKGSAANLWPE